MDHGPLFQGNIPGAGCSGGSFPKPHLKGHSSRYRGRMTKGKMASDPGRGETATSLAMPCVLLLCHSCKRPCADGASAPDLLRRSRGEGRGGRSFPHFEQALRQRPLGIRPHSIELQRSCWSLPAAHKRSSRASRPMYVLT